MSTESIAGTSSPAASSTEQCTNCGAPLAADQRYCLQCGERRVPVSSFLLGDRPGSSPPATPPLTPSDAEQPQRGNALTVIAGVGVLLLAMGVGVLIGRSSAPKQSSAPAQVISVSSAPTGAAGAGTTEATFTGSWPAGKSGYTVQLETLPVSGTTVSAVESAKTSASGKGATAVGAIKSEEFSSLTAGNYVIYSGEYKSKGEAEKALGGLRKNFSSATVVKVSNGSSSSGSSGSSGSGSSGGGSQPPSSLTKPAPPSTLKTESKAKGKSYEEQSKNLPDVVETG